MESKAGKILWNAVKLGVLFFAVGFALATVAPYLAVGFGFAPTTAAAISTLHIATAPWLGVFFGAFGVLDAVLRPAADFLFGKDGGSLEPTAQNPLIIRENAPALQIHIHQPAPQVSASEEKRADFAKRITSEREQQAHNTDIVLH